MTRRIVFDVQSASSRHVYEPTGLKPLEYSVSRPDKTAHAGLYGGIELRTLLLEQIAQERPMTAALILAVAARRQVGLLRESRK